MFEGGEHEFSLVTRDSRNCPKPAQSHLAQSYLSLKICETRGNISLVSRVMCHRCVGKLFTTKSREFGYCPLCEIYYQSFNYGLRHSV